MLIELHIERYNMGERAHMYLRHFKARHSTSSIVTRRVTEGIALRIFDDIRALIGVPLIFSVINKSYFHRRKNIVVSREISTKGRNCHCVLLK